MHGFYIITFFICDRFDIKPSVFFLIRRNPGTDMKRHTVTLIPARQLRPNKTAESFSGHLSEEKGR